MAEHSGLGHALTPNDIENRAYAELLASLDEEDKIMQEINRILETAENREEAEKVIFEKHAPLMNQALRKSREALNRWLATIQIS